MPNEYQIELRGDYGEVVASINAPANSLIEADAFGRMASATLLPLLKKQHACCETTPPSQLVPTIRIYKSTTY